MNWNEFYSMIYGFEYSQSRTRDSYNRSRNFAMERSGFRGQKTKRKLNPSLFDLSWSNPIVQHIYLDKIGDFKRTSSITQSMAVVTAYPLAPVRASGPLGWAASLLIVLAISAPIAAYANTADMLSDALTLAETQQIAGHEIVGETHDF